MSTPGMVIAGNGGAAVECFKALRRNGYSGSIDVFSDTAFPVYNPMLTSYYAAGKIDYDVMFPYGNDFSVFEDHSVCLHKEEPVTGLFAADHKVKTPAGKYPFSKCLIATGASALVPPVPGHDGPRVFVMRTVADAVRLHEAMKKGARHALVIGASMVGIKLVEMFHKAGLEVCLADMAAYIFPLAAHQDCARLIGERLLDMGVRLRFSAAIESIEDTPAGAVARFKNSDETETADLVLMCIGTRANLGFIDRQELETRQGVVIDTHMRTSAPDVYAAGDVSMGVNLLTGEPQIIGLWANARKQGRTAGCNMADGDITYPGEILHNITHFMGMDFIGLGDVRNYDRMETRDSSGHYSSLFYQGNLLTGVNLLDRFTESGIIRHSITRQALRGQTARYKRGSMLLHERLLEEFAYGR